MKNELSIIWERSNRNAQVIKQALGFLSFHFSHILNGSIQTCLPVINSYNKQETQKRENQKTEIN